MPARQDFVRADKVCADIIQGHASMGVGALHTELVEACAREAFENGVVVPISLGS
jgi:hypothetical protein